MLKDNAYKPYRVMFVIYIFFICYAFILTPPAEILSGLYKILISKDVLITDYVELAGFGGALVNVSIVGLSCTLIMYFAKIKPSGAIIMAIWLANGFSFFGKNFYNIWPGMLGVYIYHRVQRKPFSNFALVFILSSSLAPIVTHSIHIDSGAGGLSLVVAILLGILSGIICGFILPPIAAATNRVHNGYNLYNVGFASGLIGTLYLSIAKSFGIVMESNYVWGSASGTESLILIIGVCIILFIFGIKEKGCPVFSDLIKITKHSGRLVSDYYIL
ncbi:MAG: DUF1576 domain-containing protein, partial [Clostridiales bacterium]|nr:DUF1576 domain-containing protein [Clostridiales bacterium]